MDIMKFHNELVWRQLEDLQSSDRCAVYILRCLFSEAIYIGYTTKDVRTRFNTHFEVMYQDRPRGKTHWSTKEEHIRLWPDENVWMFNIPYRSDRESDLKDYERMLIREYRAAGAEIINSTNGGEGYHPQIYIPEDDHTFILMKKVIARDRAFGLELNTDIMARLVLQFPDVDYRFIRQALQTYGHVSNVGVKIATFKETYRLHALGFHKSIPHSEILSILDGGKLHKSDVVSDNIIRFLSSDNIPHRLLETNGVFYAPALRQIALEPMTIDQIVQSTLGDS